LGWPPEPDALQHGWERAQFIARRVGWEGDVREGPWFCPLPAEGSDETFLIVWKQDNNGQTFVASPYRLPWLETGDDVTSAEG
jgi:hypothetical protein